MKPNFRYPNLGYYCISPLRRFEVHTLKLHYMGRALDFLSGVDLIFFDPDNGIEIKSKPRGRKSSSKFLYWDEIAQAHRPGRSVLIYQHYVRQKREEFTDRLGRELKDITG